MTKRKIGKAAEIEIIKEWLKNAKRKYPKSKGWKILTSETNSGNIVGTKGYPDFVIINKRQKKVVFVELKSETHNYHEFQKRMVELLAAGAYRRNALLVTYRYDKNKKNYVKKTEEEALKAESDGEWEGATQI